MEQGEETVTVLSESRTAHPIRSAHAEATKVVSAPIDDVVMHSVAVSVSHCSGSEEYVGWWFDPILHGPLSVISRYRTGWSDPQTYVTSGQGGRLP